VAHARGAVEGSNGGHLLLQPDLQVGRSGCRRVRLGGHSGRRDGRRLRGLGGEPAPDREVGICQARGWRSPRPRVSATYICVYPSFLFGRVLCSVSTLIAPARRCCASRSASCTSLTASS